MMDALVFGQVDGMDCLAVKQAVKFAKEYSLKNGPMVSSSTSFSTDGCFRGSFLLPYFSVMGDGERLNGRGKECILVCSLF